MGQNQQADCQARLHVALTQTLKLGELPEDGGWCLRKVGTRNQCRKGRKFGKITFLGKSDMLFLYPRITILSSRNLKKEKKSQDRMTTKMDRDQRMKPRVGPSHCRFWPWQSGQLSSKACSCWRWPSWSDLFLFFEVQLLETHRVLKTFVLELQEDRAWLMGGCEFILSMAVPFRGINKQTAVMKTYLTACRELSAQEHYCFAETALDLSGECVLLIICLHLVQLLEVWKWKC